MKQKLKEIQNMLISPKQKNNKITLISLKLADANLVDKGKNILILH